MRGESADVVRQQLRHTQWMLRLSAGLHGVGLGLLSAAGVLALAHLTGVDTAQGRLLALVVGAGALVFEFVRRGARRLSLERAALWVEEQVPHLRYALVSAVGTSHRGVIDRDSWTRAQGHAVRSALLRAFLLALAGTGTLWLARRAPFAIWAEVGSPTRSSGPAGSGLLRVHARLVPPAYTGRKVETYDDPVTIRAVAGSQLTFTSAESVLTARLGDTALATAPGSPGRQLKLHVPAGVHALGFASPNGRRLVTLEGQVDSVPVVTLSQPARDTVFREPKGSVLLSAQLTDDFGLSHAAFEYIVSSGEGESFTFKRGDLGSRAFDAARSGALSARLSLEALQLKPGDIVHVRAVARDGNTVTGPGIGNSDTRTLRIARAGEYDSLAVEGAPPPEADKSVLSQRMLINLTEALRPRRRTLAREAFVTQAQAIARDQARLRRQVGDIIFDRLGDAPTGEHSHDTDVERPLNKEELLKAAEEATRADSEVLDFANGESPVTNINRPLLEAYNAMWDAGRELGIADLERALPHMYRALAAIQRARAAERLYLRGKAPRVVVDIARVRLQGKDKGHSFTRTPVGFADSVRVRARLRFAAAIEQLSVDPAPAIDSLVMLRVDVASWSPRAASVLDSAVETLRAQRDATAELLQARRALDGAPTFSDSVPLWSRRRGGQS
ncbi:MAG: hypothetical protein U0132_08070 [Gemmatimonadaceae bacterium]